MGGVESKTGGLWGGQLETAGAKEYNTNKGSDREKLLQKGNDKHRGRKEKQRA